MLERAVSSGDQWVLDRAVWIGLEVACVALLGVLTNLASTQLPTVMSNPRVLYPTLGVVLIGMVVLTLKKTPPRTRETPPEVQRPPTVGIASPGRALIAVTNEMVGYAQLHVTVDKTELGQVEAGQTGNFEIPPGLRAVQVTGQDRHPGHCVIKLRPDVTVHLAAREQDGHLELHTDPSVLRTRYAIETAHPAYRAFSWVMGLFLIGFSTSFVIGLSADIVNGTPMPDGTILGPNGTIGLGDIAGLALIFTPLFGSGLWCILCPIAPRRIAYGAPLVLPLGLFALILAVLLPQFH
jgi:hypothetical protein